MSGPPRLCQSSGTFKVPQKAAGEVAHRLRTCEPTRRLAGTPEPGAAPRTAALAVRVINPGTRTATGAAMTAASRRERALPPARWIIGDTLRTNEAETGSMRVNREPLRWPLTWRGGAVRRMAGGAGAGSAGVVARVR